MVNDYTEQSEFIGNKKHLKILIKSIEQKNYRIWNDWRLGNPEIPDLRGISLIGADLSNYDFSATSFDGSNLSKVNLTQCDLSGTNFYKANLNSITMLHATAYSAQFCKANLSNSNLDGSVFNFANLKGATLTGSKIRGVGHTGWQIEGIICDFIYTETKGEARFPKGRNFEQGEFEDLFKTYPLIDLEFHQNFNALTILIVNYASIQLNSENGEFDFQVKEISTYGRTPTIKVSVKTKEQIPKGTEILKKRISDLEQQLKNRQVDVDRLFGLLDNELNSKPQIQNNFNKDVSIGQFINGNNLGTQNSEFHVMTDEQYRKLTDEIESSNLPAEEKKLGRTLLEEMKKNSTKAVRKQIGSWANNLTEKGLKSLPSLVDFLSKLF